VKNSYKVKRGRVWHIIHETKTGYARNSAWTLCGQHYKAGERSARQPTCPGCLQIDNPLRFSGDMRTFINDAVSIKNWKDASPLIREPLVQADFVTPQNKLTRRGAILAEDFTEGAVPMQDRAGVVHTRNPLRRRPRCSGALDTVLPGTDCMTTDRYAKLRAANQDLVVTCLQCLAKED